MTECCSGQRSIDGIDVDQNLKCIFLFLPMLIFCAVKLTLTEVFRVGASLKEALIMKGLRHFQLVMDTSTLKSERSPDLEGITTHQP